MSLLCTALVGVYDLAVLSICYNYCCMQHDLQAQLGNMYYHVSARTAYSMFRTPQNQLKVSFHIRLLITLLTKQRHVSRHF